MPESTSDTDSKNVLSAIHRLVREDPLPLQRPDAPPADRLVLIPALLVGPSLPDAGPPFGAAEPLLPVAAPTADPGVPPSHQVAAALEAALQARDDWEPDGTEAAASTRWSAEWEATLGEYPDAPDLGQHVAAKAEAVQTLPSPDAGANPQPADSAAGDDTWDDFLAEHRTAPLLDADQADPWRPTPRPGADWSSYEAGALETADDGPMELSAGAGQMAAAEPIREATPSQEDREDGDIDGGGEDDSPWPAFVPAVLPDGRLEDGAAAPDPQEDLSVLDEDLLRDLIRDVLHEELQGELGERITRNVRKLVRAELARALTDRDLT